MRIVLAQINTVVGDIDGNRKKIRTFAAKARAKKADLVVFPELSLTGYPPRDLLQQNSFIAKNRTALAELAGETGQMGLIVGFVDPNTVKGEKRLHNAAALLFAGRIQAIRHKQLLPTYDVFDEARYFAPARHSSPILFQGRRIGLSICEDMWHVPLLCPGSPYSHDPIAALARQKVDFFINISASPFHRGKTPLRLELVKHHAKRHHRPFLFANQTGGNDDVLFDGNSFGVDAAGLPIAQSKGFVEDLAVVNLERPSPVQWEEEGELAQVRAALVMGVRDYVKKCGFQQTVLGLSGGIDSAVTAALAVEALGARNVRGVLLPSPYSSRGSLSDALALCRNLNIRHETISITPAFTAFRRSLRRSFKGRAPDITEENLQARIRGTFLMALSNKFGSLLLTTGNKSELSMGYCTLYGDMNGGLAVISDVPKTMVYRLGRLINEKHPVIPEASFTKPPSAELRPNQTDQDSLPPYEVLDALVQAYVEEGQDVNEITAMGYPRSLVVRLLNTIDRNEYKRRQAAPGLRISVNAFGTGRRFPIARGGFRTRLS